MHVWASLTFVPLPSSLLPVCVCPCLLACAAAKKATDGDEDKKKEDVGTVIGIDLGTTYSW
jgi:hypothetical protein